MQVCRNLDDDTVRALEAGAERVVLVLSEFRPPRSGVASLSVSRPGSTPQVVGVFPSEPFRQVETEAHRRFLLQEVNVTGRGAGRRICVSVRFTSPSEAGYARLHLETWSAGRQSLDPSGERSREVQLLRGSRLQGSEQG